MRVDALTGRTLFEVDVPSEGFVCGAYLLGKSRGGHEQFVVAVRGRGILVYDEDLTLLHQTPLIDGVLCIGDVNGDGENEILGTKAGSGTILLDHDLHLVASSPVTFVRNPVLQRIRQSKYSYVWGETIDGVCRLSIVTNPDYTYRIIFWCGLLLVVVATGLSARALWVTKVRVVNLRAEADKARFDAWAAMASKLAHDIRTPLSVLRLSAQNLEQELKARYEEVPVELRHYFSTFSEEANRVSEVSRSFMTFTRSTPPILESTDLGSLIRRTVERRPRSDDIHVEIALDPEVPLARVDAAQIVSLVDNILSNSYRAMKNGGTLGIGLFAEQNLQANDRKDNTPKQVVIVIRDTGCGISAEDLPRIFDPYFTRSEGGTGIGLVIAKKIVDDHAGTISIASTPNVGTTVTIRLPLR